jgi:hypothetical protein
MVVVPGAIAQHIPVAESITATAEALEAHVPPPGLPDNVVVPGSHILNVPVIVCPLPAIAIITARMVR